MSQVPAAKGSGCTRRSICCPSLQPEPVATGLSGGQTLRGAVPAGTRVDVARIQSALGRNLDKLALVQLPLSAGQADEVRAGDMLLVDAQGLAILRYQCRPARRNGRCLARRCCRICSNCSEVSARRAMTTEAGVDHMAQVAGTIGSASARLCMKMQKRLSSIAIALAVLVVARGLYPADGCRAGLPRLARLLRLPGRPQSCHIWRAAQLYRIRRWSPTRRAARWCTATSQVCWVL